MGRRNKKISEAYSQPGTFKTILILTTQQSLITKLRTDKLFQQWEVGGIWWCEVPAMAESREELDPLWIYYWNPYFALSRDWLQSKNSSHTIQKQIEPLHQSSPSIKRLGSVFVLVPLEENSLINHLSCKRLCVSYFYNQKEIIVKLFSLAIIESILE